MTLLQAADWHDGAVFRWFVLATKLHQEQKVRAQIQDSPIKNLLEAYVPEHREINQVHGGCVERVPLLSCRVFVYTTEAALAAFLQREAPEGCSICIDRTKGRPMVVSDPEMRCFMAFNSERFDDLVVLERPFANYDYDPRHERLNMRARVVDGPFAGMEGVLVRVRKDHRLVFQMGDLAVSIPRVWDFRLTRVLDPARDPEVQAQRPRRVADELVGSLQAAGWPDDAPQLLRWAAARLGQKAQLRHLQAEALAQALEQERAGADGTPWRGLEQWVAQLDERMAGQMLSLSHHMLGVSAAEVAHLLPETPIRPFLTPTAGPPMPAVGPALLAHDAYVEAVVPLVAEELHYDSATGRAREAQTSVYAHVGLRREAQGWLIFADWSAFVALRRQLDATAWAAQEKTLAEYHPSLLQVFRSADAVALHFGPVALPGSAPLQALCQSVPAGGDGLPLEAAVSFARAGLALCQGVQQSTHLALWRRSLPQLWIRG